MQIQDIKVIFFILPCIRFSVKHIKALSQEITYSVKNHIKYYMVIFSNTSYIYKGNEY